MCFHFIYSDVKPFFYTRESFQIIRVSFVSYYFMIIGIDLICNFTPKVSSENKKMYTIGRLFLGGLLLLFKFLTLNLGLISFSGSSG